MVKVLPPQYFENNGDSRDPLVVQSGFTLDDHKPNAGARLKARYALDRRRGHISSVSGLPNRVGFEQAFKRYKREHGLTNCEGFIVFFDVNGLKEMNDNHGHALGDALLKSTGEILKRIDGVAVHLSGDEFVAFVPANRTSEPNGLTRFIASIRRDRSIEKRSDRPTDVEGLLKRLDDEFAKNYIRLVEQDGSVVAEFDISISRGAVKIEGRRFEDLQVAIEQADLVMQEHKESRKEILRAELIQKYRDEKSGRAEFVELMGSQINRPGMQEIRELATELGLANLDECESKQLGSLDPRVIELHEALLDAGFHDSARYLTGLVIGKPMYLSRDIGLLGQEGLGRYR